MLHGDGWRQGLEKASEKAKAERAAEVERMLEEKRDLEAKLRESENQADWARGERDEEVARAGREKRELSQRLKDAEQQLLRLKVRPRPTRVTVSLIGYRAFRSDMLAHYSRIIR